MIWAPSVVHLRSAFEEFLVLFLVLSGLAMVLLLLVSLCKGTEGSIKWSCWMATLYGIEQMGIDVYAKSK